MKHIKENILFSLIDGSIDKSERETHETHISECDACFSLYASLKSSYVELTSEELSPAPAELYNRVEAELGLKEDVVVDAEPISYWDKFTNWVSNKLDSGLTPVLVPIAAVAIVTFIIINENQDAISIQSGNIAEEKSENVDSDADAIVDVKEDEKNNLTIDMQNQKQDMGNIVLGGPEKKTPEITIAIDLDEPEEIDYDELDVLAENDEFEVLIPYWDPADSEISTRFIPGPAIVPDLSEKSLEQIQRTLKAKGIKHIIYKSKTFKQSVMPNESLKSTDTLKVFFPHLK